jgi:hypothetical protein
VTGDDPMRTLLQQIAASAGDPPEHGLEGLAARRRRRARHRRGAVATTVALAVLVVAVGPWLSELGDHEDVRAADSANPGRHAQLPDVLTVRCTPDGIDVPVASIRPQGDGLNIAVDNTQTGVTQVWVRSSEGEGWDSGLLDVDPGHHELREPVPPGVLTVGCSIDGRDEQREVELVDVGDVYDEPELDCEADERVDDGRSWPVSEPTPSYSNAVARALTDLMQDGAQVRAYGAYPDEVLGSVKNDPLVRVVRDDQNVAFLQLEAQSVDADAPRRDPLWANVVLVEGCRSFLTATPPTSTGG